MENRVIRPAGLVCGDGVGLYGEFSLRVYDHSEGSAKLLRTFTKRNQITNQGREALLQLMCPVTVVAEQNRIWSLAVGTNATPPAITDTDTTMTVVWQEAFDFIGGECIIVAVPPNDYQLAISKIMPLSAGVGSTLQEAGIFTRGDNDDPALATLKKLYARQKFSPIIKTGTMTIQFDWQLGIKIQS